MSQRKIFVVGNLFAGKKKVRKVLGELKFYLDSQDQVFELFDTQEFGNATKTVKNKLDETFSDLIIIGGDGTINESINGLQSNIPVSIIPAGTGNDFVKNVQLGRTQEEIFHTALFGEIKQVDLGKCNDRLFANGVGIGFDGQIVEDMLSKRVPLLTGHAAYYYHVLRILGSYKERPFAYQVDSESLRKELILLTIGNGTTFGGGFKLMPEATIDDGMLEVCEIGNVSPLRRFLNINKLSGGTHDRLSEVCFHKAKSVRVDKNESLFAHIDGEWLGQPPFEISILPSALNLRVSNVSA